MALWYRPSSSEPATRADGAPHEPGAITGPYQRLDELAGSCSPGPFARDVVRVMGNSKLLSRVPRIQDKAENDFAADAYGYNAVLVCLDVKSEKFGVWGLNVTGDREIKDMQAHGTQAAYGWYVHLYGEVPNAQQWYDLSGKSPGWSADATKQLQDYMPEVYKQVRRLQGFPDDTAAAPANLPPGPEGYTATDNVDENPVEFSVVDDGAVFWVAKTPPASAAKKSGNPHPGVSIINPGAWEKYSGGQTPADALDLDEYREMGWTGLDRKVLAWQDGGTVTPAGEEMGTAMEAAMKGDTGALRALKAIGVKPPAGMEEQQRGGFHFGNLKVEF